jgi:hypothetical protein
LRQAPEHVEGEEKKRLGTPGFCNPYVDFSQAPERVEGESLLCEGGGGSARLIADDCLKYLSIKSEKRVQEKEIHSLILKLFYE